MLVLLVWFFCRYLCAYAESPVYNNTACSTPKIILWHNIVGFRLKDESVKHIKNKLTCTLDYRISSIYRQNFYGAVNRIMVYFHPSSVQRVCSMVAFC